MELDVLGGVPLHHIGDELFVGGMAGVACVPVFLSAYVFQLGEAVV